MASSQSGQLPGSVQRLPVADGAEAFVEMLVANDVEYIFLNSGTDTFPIQEALARMMEQERKVPQVIICPDESTALGAAHGYYQLTGRTQVVLVHVDAGTVQLGGGYHNVQRDHAGLVICAGRPPATVGDTLHGGKDMSIHWLQEQRDQNGIVRTFTKWDYELRRNESIHMVVQKAFQVASSEPAGPVYLTLPRENLLEPMDELRLPSPQRHGTPVGPSADPDALRTLADWLVTANAPLLILGTPGRHPETVQHIQALAEAVGARVTGALTTRLNMPSDHPLNIGMMSPQQLREADVVLVIDHDVPWIPSMDNPEPSGKIAWIDADPTKDSIPLWNFPADLLIHAAPQKAVPALVAAVNERLTAQDKERIAGRVAEISKETSARREASASAAQQASSERPLSPAWITYCLSQVLPQDAIVMNESVRSAPAVLANLRRTQPGTFFGSGGASLGWGVTASLGAKLAEPERDVVTIVGDGSFIFSRPLSVYWAAERYAAPFLTIVLNNARHRATYDNWNTHIPNGAAKRTGNFVGVDLDPSPDYEVLITATRGYGEKVEDPAEVLPAIERALERVRGGQSALLNMIISR